MPYICLKNIRRTNKFIVFNSNERIPGKRPGIACCIYLKMIVSLMDVKYMYMDIMTGENCRKFRLLFPLAFIGQFFNPVGGGVIR